MSIKGGDKLTKRLEELKQKLTNAKSVDIGFLGDADYSNGTPVAFVAATQEYGNGRIPPRPFFRNAIQTHKGKWGAMLKKALQTSDGDARKALTIMGAEIQDEIKESIIDFSGVPLSPITLMLRKMKAEGIEITGKQVGIAAARVAKGESTSGVNDKQLIETGVMLDAVNYRVNE